MNQISNIAPCVVGLFGVIFPTLLIIPALPNIRHRDPRIGRLIPAVWVANNLLVLLVHLLFLFLNVGILPRGGILGAIANFIAEPLVMGMLVAGCLLVFIETYNRIRRNA